MSYLIKRFVEKCSFYHKFYIMLSSYFNNSQSDTTLSNKTLEKNKLFITNLGKCTQIDARPLPDEVLKKYLDLLFKEINIIKPKIIITFGNQVSSIILNKKISVSENRKKCHKIQINKNEYKVYPVYYPVGNGIFNIDKSIEDIKWIIENEIKKEEQNLLCKIL